MAKRADSFVDKGVEATAKALREKRENAEAEANVSYPINGEGKRLPPGDYSKRDDVVYARSGLSDQTLDNAAAAARKAEAGNAKAQKTHADLGKKFPVRTKK